MKLITTTGALRAIGDAVRALTVNPDGSQSPRPAKLAYWLARTALKVQPEYDASEQARLALAEQFGTKSEDGTQYLFEGDQATLFNLALGDLMATEIEIDLPQISVAAFENIEVVPALMMALDPVLVD